ncbi:DinB family protein [Reichenbachiella carrageenanivorans]|uniref:DinB family protein n=1 Tax=Reichenbachiella carrageenanivorans TaxID=2979869 RepID=A0ABY6D2U9_9BACT|nr:DinB family protein [Reichenbachiella carrageenanivorans]UXX80491.1 DinB family protein [Reichenbachiella carrageenanivorans]
MNTNVESIKQVLLRDLTVLEKEINAYDNPSDLWLIDGDIKNSAGNLTLHLCGNLQHFVGAIVGADGYIRQRELEFGQKDLPIGELQNEIQQTKLAIEKALNKLSDSDLEKTYPLEVFGKPITFSYFLIHLTGHLMYHLGQINYHRRLLAS